MNFSMITFMYTRPYHSLSAEFGFFSNLSYFIFFFITQIALFMLFVSSPIERKTLSPLYDDISFLQFYNCMNCTVFFFFFPSRTVFSTSPHCSYRPPLPPWSPPLPLGTMEHATLLRFLLLKLRIIFFYQGLPVCKTVFFIPIARLLPH